MQAYVGYHSREGTRPFPEYSAAVFPHSLFESSSLFTDACYKSAAIAFRRASFQLSPVDVPTASYHFSQSSVWYSVDSRAAADPLLDAAEAARDSGDLDWAYGAAVNPTGAYPGSSASGEIPLPPLAPQNSSGPPWMQVVSQDVLRTSGFLFTEADGLPQPLEDGEVQGFGVTVVSARGGAVKLTLPRDPPARGESDSMDAEGADTGSLDTRVKLWQVLAAVAAAVVLTLGALAAWLAVRRHARAARETLPTAFPGPMSPQKARSSHRGDRALHSVAASAGASSSGRGGVYGDVNELEMTEDGVRSGVEGGEPGAGPEGYNGYKFRVTESPSMRSTGGDSGLGAVDTIVPDLSPPPQATKDTGCGSGVVGLGMSGGWSGGWSAGPSGGLIGGGWAHMGGVSRCFVPNSVALAALQNEQWLDMAAETEATHVQGKVAVAVKEMQGALQTELQDDHLQLLGVLGRGGFGVVYHGAAPAARRATPQPMHVGRE